MVKITGTQIKKSRGIKSGKNKFSKELCEPTWRPERSFCSAEKNQSTIKSLKQSTNSEPYPKTKHPQSLQYQNWFQF